MSQRRVTRDSFIDFPLMLRQFAGNRGPEAFYEVQETVYNQLEEKFYPQFLVSEIYHKFIVSWDGETSTNSADGISYGSNDG